MSFKILGDIEHIQTRPGMYIGNTFSPNHLCYEVIDNSLDELVNNFANRITIDNPTSGHIIVTDDGRGIPIKKVLLEGKPVDSVVAACIKLFSGAKFDESAYSFAIGLHGVGLTAVNALSKSLSITIRDREFAGIFHHYQFENANFIKKEELKNGKVLWNTRVEFIVDPKYFTISNFNIEQIYDRMCLVASKTKKDQIYINEKKVPKGTFEQFIRSQLDIPEEIPVCKISKDNVDVYFTYDLNSQNQSVINGDVNLHSCGGTYQANWNTVYSNCVIKKFGNITKYEALSNLRTYVTMYINEPSYDSQSKMNMTKNISDIMQKMIPDINRQLSSKYIKECITTIMERRSLKRVTKVIKKKKKRISADNGFKDCLNTPGDILYIMEGKSADGSLSQIRNKRTEAILPISGKILNVVKSSMEKAVNSKKFKFLLEVLGVQFNKKARNNYRYNTIKILADADPDGLHISVLVILSLWYYAPQLIREQRVKVILPPLYGVVKGQKFIPIYDLADCSKYKGHQILRFKGIGEMSPNQLEVIIRDQKKEYTILPPESQAENDNIIRCITDTELKRKLCEDERFSLSTLFKYI
jgi:DNA gyrase subunit B